MAQLTDAEVCAAIAEATYDNAMPRVLIETVFAGVHVAIVEPCMLRLDGVDRGYLWHAVGGDFELRASYLNDGRTVPGKAHGGELLATSTVSAAACLTNARRALRARAAGV